MSRRVGGYGDAPGLHEGLGVFRFDKLVGVHAILTRIARPNILGLLVYRRVVRHCAHRG